MNRSEAIRIPIMVSANEAEDPTGCPRCGKHDPKTKYLGWRRDVAVLKELQENVSECEVCRMVVACLQAYRASRCPELSLPGRFALDCHPGVRFRIRLAKDGATMGEEADGLLPKNGLEIYTTPTSDATTSPLKHAGKGTPISKDYSSRECLDLAKSWIRKCRQQHENCKIPSSHLLPTRVLDVGSSRAEPKLVESNGAHGQWIALSHCWGKERPLVTTHNVLDRHKTSIPFASLPKTFQDAVLIARALEFQYLWIDSLCIIQDSQEDWQVESAKMEHVYAGAALTVAAMAAQDSRHGCFVSKEGWRESIPVEVSDAESGTGTVYIREWIGASHNISSTGTGEPFENLPLAGRAWVQQERILSTRILMYTDCELCFECRTSIWCECGLHPFSQVMSPSSRKPYQHLFSHSGKSTTASSSLQRREGMGRAVDVALSKISLTPTLHTGASLIKHALIDKHLLNRPEIHTFWHRTIKTYTRRNLTYDRDVLPAISAIATTIHQKLGDEYLAGLWRDELPAALLWSRTRPPFTLSDEDFTLLATPGLKLNIPDSVAPYVPRRPEEDSPPSWSWASVRGATSWGGPFLTDPDDRFRKVQDPAVVHRVSCFLTTPNPMGSVSGGELEMEGYLREVRIRSYGLHRQTLLHRCHVADMICTAETNKHAHVHDGNCLRENNKDWAILDVPLPKDHADATKTLRVWRLRVGIFPPTGPEWVVPWNLAHELIPNSQEVCTSHYMHYFLLLVRGEKKGLSGDCYERIGLYVMDVGPGETYPRGNLSRVRIR